MESDIAIEIQKAELVRMQKKNKLLDLEIELQKVLIKREEILLKVDRRELNKKGN